jgi:hypothetical protein
MHIKHNQNCYISILFLSFMNWIIIRTIGHDFGNILLRYVPYTLVISDRAKIEAGEFISL